MRKNKNIYTKVINKVSYHIVHRKKVFLGGVRLKGKALWDLNLKNDEYIHEYSVYGGYHTKETSKPLPQFYMSELNVISNQSDFKNHPLILQEFIKFAKHIISREVGV
jgi:hypothetical protein